MLTTPRSTTVLSIGISALLLAAAATANAAPANDAFADATPLTGVPVEAEASNVGATSEPGEPIHGYPDAPRGGHSLWWRWTPDRSGHVAVETCGSSVDTMFSVYTGTALDALSVVGGDGESASSCGDEDSPHARVAFFATAGQTYHLAVDTVSPPDDPERAFGRVRLEVRHSGSVAVRQVRGQSGTLAKLVYRAAPGELNFAGIALDWDPTADLFLERPEPRSDPVAYWVDEQMSPGPGCERRNFGLTCAIPPGARATGPLIYLGDGNDRAEVGFSRAGTRVVGGPGNDTIHAGGRISAGPGDDEVQARTWVRSQITGGPGRDTILGSRREDVIDAGPGMDEVNANLSFSGRDVVRTRDGEIDAIDCSGGEAFIDGLDTYGPHCAVSRRGAARVIPEQVFLYLMDRLAQVWVDCPADGPRVCVGSLEVSAPSVALSRSFRVTREDRQFGETGFLDLPATARELRRLVGSVKVTVRSRDRAGKLRRVTRVFHGVGLE